MTANRRAAFNTAAWLDAAEPNEFCDDETRFWQRAIAVALTRIAEALEDKERIGDLEAAHNVLTDNYHKANQQRQELRLALEAAVKTLRLFHGERNWELFYRNAPELAKVRAVLGPDWNP